MIIIIFFIFCRQEEENKLGQRNIETEKIKAILEARALKIKDIPSDGDCLFAGVIHQLQNNMKVSELRTISSHVFTNSLTMNLQKKWRNFIFLHKIEIKLLKKNANVTVCIKKRHLQPLNRKQWKFCGKTRRFVIQNSWKYVMSSL